MGKEADRGPSTGRDGNRGRDGDGDRHDSLAVCLGKRGGNSVGLGWSK